jgi:hypothetical protein
MESGDVKERVNIFEEEHEQSKDSGVDALTEF